MSCDDKFDQWIVPLCTCARCRHTCEWHRRLRGQYDTRSELGLEMEDIVKTSHAIHMGVMEPPEGWEQIHGRNAEYWAPADRGR